MSNVTGKIIQLSDVAKNVKFTKWLNRKKETVVFTVICHIVAGEFTLGGSTLFFN